MNPQTDVIPSVFRCIAVSNYHSPPVAHPFREIRIATTSLETSSPSVIHRFRSNRENFSNLPYRERIDNAHARAMHDPPNHLHLNSHSTPVAFPASHKSATNIAEEPLINSSLAASCSRSRALRWRVYCVPTKSNSLTKKCLVAVMGVYFGIKEVQQKLDALFNRVAGTTSSSMHPNLSDGERDREEEWRGRENSVGSVFERILDRRQTSYLDPSTVNVCRTYYVHTVFHLPPFVGG